MSESNKVGNLEGVELDRAVSDALGYRFTYREMTSEEIKNRQLQPPEPWSTSWELGAQIIERERIAIYPYEERDEWYGQIQRKRAGRKGYDTIGAAGPTPLVAAMRAFVAARQK